VLLPFGNPDASSDEAVIDLGKDNVRPGLGPVVCFDIVSLASVRYSEQIVHPIQI